MQCLRHQSTTVNAQSQPPAVERASFSCSGFTLDAVKTQKRNRR